MDESCLRPLLARLHARASELDEVETRALRALVRRIEKHLEIRDRQLSRDPWRIDR